MLQPRRFGRYLLTQKLATGGMAEIFLAKFIGTAGFEKELVIKKILPQWTFDHEFTSMLIDEAKIVVQLNHANIAQVFELGREGESYYIAMEYVAGLDLRRFILPGSHKKSLPLDVALFVVSEVLEGLSYAHQKKDSQGVSIQLVHRDISPQNILLSFDGAVKITDFGIAKASLKNHETLTGVLKGKFAYMSPEQANQDPLDSRSDLFAVGIILYELVTGERLFAGKGDMDTLDRVRRAHVVFHPEIEKGLPKPLRDIILKSLSKDLSQRYPSAADFREELLLFVSQSGFKMRRTLLADYLNRICHEDILRWQRESDDRETRTRRHLESVESPKGNLPEETVTVGTLAETRVEAHGGTTRVLVASGRLPESGVPEGRPPKGRWSSPHPLRLSVFLLAVGLLGWFFWRHEHRKPDSGKPGPGKVLAVVPPQPVVTSHQVLAAPPAPVVKSTPAPTPSATPPPAKGNLPSGNLPKTRGLLSVQAIPWGYVSIDGGGRLETPLQKRSLETGTHRLDIFYEPSQIRLSQKINLKTDQHLLCIANFRENEKTVTCNSGSFY